MACFWLVVSWLLVWFLLVSAHRAIVGWLLFVVCRLFVRCVLFVGVLRVVCYVPFVG